jgi:hypothetical protein
MVEDFYPVEWAGRQAVVALPEHIGIANAGRVRDELLSVINGKRRDARCSVTSTTRKAQFQIQRPLALNACIWHNWLIGAPVKRSLIAYDHT